MEALLTYFCRFGHLACFASDVEMFLQVLTIDEKMELLDKIRTICDCPSTFPIKVLGQSITFFKIQDMFGVTFKLPLDELEGTAVRMIEMYCKNLSLSKDLDPQENMYGEELLSMACNVLVQLFWRTKHVGYLLEAIMVLEFGLTIRRYISQYKILLLHLYSHLNALPLAYEWYKTLDIKNILLETVSHHILPQMLVSPLWVDLFDLLKDYLKFMDDHFRESADLTFLAYRHRNYSKVIEFVQFKERLQHSSQYLLGRVETPILQLKQKADSIEEEECILETLDSGIQLLELASEERCKTLTFNEDLQSRPWWTPTSDINYLLGQFEGASFCLRNDLQEEYNTRDKNVRKVIERRSLLPRLIYLSIRCAASSLKENVDSNGSISETKICLELKCLLEKYAKSLGFSFNDAVQEIVGVSTNCKSFEAFGSSMIDWMNFAVFLNAWNLGSHEVELPNGDGTGPGCWNLVGFLIEKYVLGSTQSMKSLMISPGSDLPILIQLVTEPLAWHGLVIQSCLRASLPLGKKKKKSGPAEHLSSPLFHALRGSIHSLCGSVEGITNWLKDQINKPEDPILDALISTLQSGTKEGPGLVFQILNASKSTMGDLELGGWISEALQSWSPIEVGRKILNGQRKTLTEFLRICEPKLKLFQSLKQQIQVI